MSVTVKKISFDELRQAAVDTHNEYYESRAEKAGNFHIDIDAVLAAPRCTICKPLPVQIS